MYWKIADVNKDSAKRTQLMEEVIPVIMKVIVLSVYMYILLRNVLFHFMPIIILLMTSMHTLKSHCKLHAHVHQMI